MISSHAPSSSELLVIALCSLSLLAGPPIASAQSDNPASLRPEVFTSIAWGHLFRVEDQSFGHHPNIGASLNLRPWPRFGIEFELNKTLGSPQPVPCPSPGTVAVYCVGRGGDQVLAAAIASANVSYFFSTSGIQPYLSGSIGVLESEEAFIQGHITEAGIVLTEQDRVNRGLAENVGAGVLIPITRAVSLRPELRVYFSTLQSRSNLTYYRGSIGVGYQW